MLSLSIFAFLQLLLEKALICSTMEVADLNPKVVRTDDMEGSASYDAASPHASVMAQNGGDADEDLERAKAESEEACRDVMRTHLSEFMAANGSNATFEAWIAMMHPENVRVDHRMSLPDSSWLQLWKEARGEAHAPVTNVDTTEAVALATPPRAERAVPAVDQADDTLDQVTRAVEAATVSDVESPQSTAEEDQGRGIGIEASDHTNAQAEDMEASAPAVPISAPSVEPSVSPVSPALARARLSRIRSRRAATNPATDFDTAQSVGNQQLPQDTSYI